MITFTKQGDLETTLKRHVRNVAERCARGMLAVAHVIEEKSQELVPVDTGALRDSMREKIQGTGFDQEVIVSYGDLDHGPVKRYSTREKRFSTRDPSKYAGLVHERADWSYQGGRAHDFLRTPILQNHPEMWAALLAEVAKHA